MVMGCFAQPGNTCFADLAVQGSGLELDTESPFRGNGPRFLHHSRLRIQSIFAPVTLTTLAQ